MHAEPPSQNHSHYHKHYVTHIFCLLLKAAAVFSLINLSIAFANNFYEQLEYEDLKLAESVISNKIEKEPDNSNARLDLGFIQYYLGKSEDAQSTFLELTNINTLKDSTNLYYGLALTQYDLDQEQESLRNIVKAYTLAPENYKILKLYADISHTMNLHKPILGELDDSSPNEDKVTKDESTEITFQNALQAYKDNNIALAREQLEELLADNPNDTDTLVLLAFIMYREGNSEEAEGIFSELVKLDNFKDNSDVLYGLALAQRNRGKEHKALESVLRAIISESSREDLVALYRSLSIQLSVVPIVVTDEVDLVTTKIEDTPPIKLTLNDVIADITSHEDFNSGQ